MNVRAPRPPEQPQEETTEEAPATYQFSYNEAKGIYRVRPWRDDEVEAQPGFEEMSRHRTPKTLTEEFERIATAPVYVVLENTSTGEVFVEGDFNLHDNWTQDGSFDQITIFDSEEEAHRYADERSSG